MSTTPKPEDVLKLLERSEWTYLKAEFGAAAVDPKRPYGFSGFSAVMSEIHEILGHLPVAVKDDEDVYSAEQHSYAMACHEATVDVLKSIFTDDNRDSLLALLAQE